MHDPEPTNGKKNYFFMNRKQDLNACLGILYPKNDHNVIYYCSNYPIVEKKKDLLYEWKNRI